MTATRVLSWSWAFALAIAVPQLRAAAQQQKTAPQNTAQPAANNDKTTAKPLSAKEKRKREEKLRQELETPYKKWLDEDVAYIITDEERAAFKRLQTDEEREQFIEQFWLRRDPTPDTVENEYKEEHYRRIAYANEHFSSGIPGWKTDRGRIYIMYGPPDEIDSHPSGGSYERPIEEGGGETSTYPFEDWRYRYIEGIGTDVNIEFVDPTMTGEYHMTMDPSEKDALLYVPGAGLTLYEEMGLADKTDRFTRSDGTHLGTGNQPLPESMDEFSRLEQFAKLQKPPEIKFKDLEAVVNSRITFNLLPVKVRVDYLRITDSTVMTTVTVQLDNKDLQFQEKDGVAKANVNMYTQVTSMTRRPVGHWEDPVVIEMPQEMLAEASKHSSVYQHPFFLAPGLYRLNVVVKDTVGGTMNNYEMALHVPHFDDEKLAASSLILADLIEPVPTSSIGTGQFVIGDYKVRPRINDTFNRDEKLGIYLQLYNFQTDEHTRKPSGEIEYQVLRNGTNEKVFDYTEDVKDLPGASGTQVTIEKLLPLATLKPGQYTLKMTVKDKLRNQELTPTATFTVH
jgi:GWxTD domain-containing protein